MVVIGTAKPSTNAPRNDNLSLSRRKISREERVNLSWWITSAEHESIPFGVTLHMISPHNRYAVNHPSRRIRGKIIVSDAIVCWLELMDCQERSVIAFRLWESSECLTKRRKLLFDVFRVNQKIEHQVVDIVFGEAIVSCEIFTPQVVVQRLVKQSMDSYYTLDKGWITVYDCAKFQNGICIHLDDILLGYIPANLVKWISLSDLSDIIRYFLEFSNRRQTNLS